MKCREFEEKVKHFKVGDFIRLVIRGNYGKYVHEAELKNVENGRIYLDSGKSHSYQRIVSMGFHLQEV